jgi:hypothetical protein
MQRTGRIYLVTLKIELHVFSRSTVFLQQAFLDRVHVRDLDRAHDRDLDRIDPAHDGET